MALILKCEGPCGKEMRRLEPHKVVDDKYFCLKCAELKETEKSYEQQINTLYGNIPDSLLPYIGLVPLTKPPYILIDPTTITLIKE